MSPDTQSCNTPINPDIADRGAYKLGILLFSKITSMTFLENFLKSKTYHSKSSSLEFGYQNKDPETSLVPGM